MATDQSEEFRKFILENREIVESILNEGKKKSEDLLEENVDKAKAKAKDVGDAMFTILNDDDVQKHFITGCLEFIHFFEAVVKAAPMSPEAREAVEKFEQSRDNAIKNVVMAGAKDRMESININDKTKTAPKKKAKVENITVRDVKSSKKETGKKA